MLGYINNKVTKIRHNLSSLDRQPIGKAALTVLIFLDLFILISIFDGLSDHTRQLTRPDQLIPQYCRDMVIEGEWSKTGRLKQLAQKITDERGRYYFPRESERNQQRHPVCAPIATLLLSIEDDNALSANLKELLSIERETDQLNTGLARINSAYDTTLLGKIAGQDEIAADVESLRKESVLKSAAINIQISKYNALVSAVEQDKRIRELFAIVDSVTEPEREQLRDELRRLNFWHPVKRLGMEMLFLVPLFLVFYFWNVKSISGKRPFQVLVSSHLLVIVFIPVLIKLIELVYDIIPRKLLQHIIELLESLKLVAIWHYLLMGVIILAALAMIYLFQQKLFSREKLIEKRISKGACQNCGKNMPANSVACPFCGFEQFKLCENCNKPTFVYGRYCKECGHD